MKPIVEQIISNKVIRINRIIFGGILILYVYKRSFKILYFMLEEIYVLNFVDI